jgi:hypothetical protein
MTEEFKNFDDYYYDDEEYEDKNEVDENQSNSNVKINEVNQFDYHHHECLYCGCKYKHIHRLKIDPISHDKNQFDFQCPYESCEMYFGKGNSKQRENLCKAVLCKKPQIGGFDCGHIAEDFGQWTYDSDGDYKDCIASKELISNRHENRGQMKNELRFTAMVKRCLEGTIILYVGSYPSFYLKRAMLYNKKVLIICIDPSNITTTLPSTHKFHDNGVYFFQGRAEQFIEMHLERLRLSIRRTVYYSDLRSTDPMGEMTYDSLAADISLNCLMVKNLPRLSWYEYKFSVGPVFKDRTVFMPAQYVRDTIWDRQNGNELLAFGKDKSMIRPNFSHMRLFKQECNTDYVNKQNGRMMHLADCMGLHELTNRMMLYSGHKEPFSAVCKCNRGKVCAKCTLVLDTKHELSDNQIAKIWNKYHLHVVAHSRKYYGAHPPDRTGRDIRSRVLYNCLTAEESRGRVDDVHGSVKRFGRFPVNVIRPKITSNDYDMWEEYGGHPRLCSCDPNNHTCGLDNNGKRTSMVIDVHWMDRLDYLKLARHGSVYVSINLFGLQGKTKGQLGQCEWEIVQRGNKNYVSFDPLDSEKYVDPLNLWWNDFKYYHADTGELLKWKFLSNDYYGEKDLGIPQRAFIKMWLSTPGRFELEENVEVKKTRLPNVGILGNVLGRFKMDPENDDMMLTRSVVNSGMKMRASKKHVEYVQASLLSAANITAHLTARTASKFHKLLDDEGEQLPECRGYSKVDNKIYYAAELVQYCAASIKLLRSAAYTSHHNANVDLLYEFASGKSMNNILAISMISFKMLMIMLFVCLSVGVVMMQFFSSEATRFMLVVLMSLYALLAIGELTANSLGLFHPISWYVNTILYKINGCNYDIYLHYIKSLESNSKRLHGKTLPVMSKNANYENKTKKSLSDTKDCVNDNETDYTNPTSIGVWNVGVLFKLFFIFQLFIWLWHKIMSFEVDTVDDEYTKVMMIFSYVVGLFWAVWNAFNWCSCRPKRGKGKYGVTFFKHFLEENSDTLSDGDLKQLLAEIRQDVFENGKLRDLYDHFVLSLPTKFSCKSGLMDLRGYEMSTFRKSKKGKFRSQKNWFQCLSDWVCCSKNQGCDELCIELVEFGNEQEVQAQVDHHVSKLQSNGFDNNEWFSCCRKKPSSVFEDILQRNVARIEPQGYSNYIDVESYSEESMSGSNDSQFSEPKDVVLEIGVVGVEMSEFSNNNNEKRCGTNMCTKSPSLLE